MTTDALMALISKKVPKNIADIQALRDKFNKFDDKERDELLSEMSAKILLARAKRVLWELLKNGVLAVFVYIGITQEWFNRHFFDDIGSASWLSFVSSIWKKIYDNPGFVAFIIVLLATISVVPYFFRGNKEENLEIINKTIEQKALDKR